MDVLATQVLGSADMTVREVRDRKLGISRRSGVSLAAQQTDNTAP